MLNASGCEVVLAGPNDQVFRRLIGLDRARFPAIRSTAIYGDLRDAMLHATTRVDAGSLCRDCRARGRCAGLNRALEEIGELDATPVPSVRAVIARRDDDAETPYTPHTSEDRNGHGHPSPHISGSSDPVRVTPVTSWNRRKGLPRLHPTAFVDPLAVVIGEVAVGERVYIGPGVSIRADEGTPFFIGAGTNVQDGVTLHALKGRVVLIGGRPYAIHVGSNVCLTHHALIHGPCHIGDGCFIGFKATVHDAIVGENCVLGMGAVVIGVQLPAGRYVGHNAVIDSQEKADALPPADEAWLKLREEVVEVNRELASGHRESFEERIPEASAMKA